MRHQKKRHLLGRPADQRKAVLRALATALLRHDSIHTTEAKAKALQPVVEGLITLAVRAHRLNAGTEANRVAQALHLRRQAAAYIYDKAVVKRLFDEMAPGFLSKPGGYSRLVKTPPRRGDAAPMAIITVEG